MTDNPADKARSCISEAFAEINQLPHGTEQDATGLIEAQSHLAAARRALDAWQQAHEAQLEALQQSMTEIQRCKVEDLLKRLDESEKSLEGSLGGPERPEAKT